MKSLFEKRNRPGILPFHITCRLLPVFIILFLCINPLADVSINAATECCAAGKESSIADMASKPVKAEVAGNAEHNGISDYSGSFTTRVYRFYLPLVLIFTFTILTIISLKKQISKKNSDLRLSEEKFRLIFEHSPVGIIHFDKNGIITACNSSLEKIIGSERGKLLGIDITSLPNVKVSRTIKQVLSGNTGSIDGTYNSVTSDKSTPLRALFAPLSDSDNKIIGGIGIIEDVTPRKMYEDKLLKEREAAERANRAKSIFLANMSHEVRTPLNGILGILQLLKNSSHDIEQYEMISMAIKSGGRLTRLLSDILDLTKIETEHFILINENINIRELLGSIRSSLSEECVRKGVSLGCIVSEAVPELIIGDELRVRQVIQNLAENSIKFTSSGSIKIEADFIFNGDSAGDLAIVVSDTGIGIEHEKLAEILEPFRQAENTYTRRYQGAGLGLAIVKRLVNHMGGNIEISSNPGEGTNIKCTMKLKAFDEGDKHSAIPAGKTHPDIRSLKILLVEDERINRLMTHRLLEKMNHNVTDASNGLEAIEHLNRSDFDLILMDIQMPEMNGIDAIREIRKEERFGLKSSVKVIALTAYAMAGDREKFLEAGFNEYIPKPVDMEDLESVIIRLELGT